MLLRIITMCNLRSQCFTSSCPCYSAGRACDESVGETCAQCYCNQVVCRIFGEHKARVSRQGWTSGPASSESQLARSMPARSVIEWYDSAGGSVGLQQFDLAEGYKALGLPLQGLQEVEDTVRRWWDKGSAEELPHAYEYTPGNEGVGGRLKIHFGPKYRCSVVSERAKGNTCSTSVGVRGDHCKECAAARRDFPRDLAPVPDVIIRHLIRPLIALGVLGEEQGGLAVNAAQVNVYNGGGGRLLGHFDSHHWADPAPGVVSIRLLEPATMLLNTTRALGAKSPCVKVVPLPRYAVTVIKGPSLLFVNHEVVDQPIGSLSAAIILRRIHPELLEQIQQS